MPTASHKASKITKEGHEDLFGSSFFVVFVPSWASWKARGGVHPLPCAKTKNPPTVCGGRRVCMSPSVLIYVTGAHTPTGRVAW